MGLSEAELEAKKKLFRSKIKERQSQGQAGAVPSSSRTSNGGTTTPPGLTPAVAGSVDRLKELEQPSPPAASRSYTAPFPPTPESSHARTNNTPNGVAGWASSPYGAPPMPQAPAHVPYPMPPTTPQHMGSAAAPNAPSYVLPTMASPLPAPAAAPGPSSSFSYDMLTKQVSDMSAELTTKRIKLKTVEEERDRAVQQAKRAQQAVDILVDEKTELTAQVQAMAARLQTLEGQVGGLTGQLGEAERRAQSAEQQLSNQTGRLSRHQSVQDGTVEQSAKLQEVKAALAAATQHIADLAMGNDELQSKLQRQAAEMEQLQSQQPPRDDGREAETLRSECRELRGRLVHAEEELGISKERERDMASQLQESAAQMASLSAALADVQKQKDVQAERHSDTEARLQTEIDRLAASLAQAQQKRTEGTQSPRPSSPAPQQKPSTPPLSPQTAAVKEVKDENAALVEKLRADMARMASEHAAQLAGLHKKVSELESEAVDKASLLTTVHSNAQTLSRVTLQNRDLKAQLAEVQDRFVDVIKQQMETVTELQAEQHAARQWKARVEELEQELGEEAPPHVDTERMARAERHEQALAQQMMTLQAERTKLQGHIRELTAANEHLAQQLHASRGVPPRSPRPMSTPGTPRAPSTPVLRTAARPQSVPSPLPPAASDTLQPPMAVPHVHGHPSPLQVEGEAATDECAENAVAESHVPEDEQGAEAALEAEAEWAEMQGRVEELEGEVARLGQEVERLTAERDSLAGKLAQEKQTVEQLASEAEAIPTYITLFHQQRKMLEQKSEEHHSEAAQLRAEIERLGRQLRGEPEPQPQDTPLTPQPQEGMPPPQGEGPGANLAPASPAQNVPAPAHETQYGHTHSPRAHSAIAAGKRPIKHGATLEFPPCAECGSQTIIV